MKAVCLYVEGHGGSINQAKRCIKVGKEFGFKVHPLPGSTPYDMKSKFEWNEIEDGRVRIFKKENFKKYATKKACFSNHVRIWKEVVKRNHNLIVLEHDAIAIKKWDNPEFEDVLVLNMESAMSRSIFNSTRAPATAYKYPGSIPLAESQSKLIYNRDNEFKESFMVPGTAAYAISPTGAEKLLNALDEYGWEQSDYFINTFNVDIKYTVPDYFKLDKNNLHLSHGV